MELYGMSLHVSCAQTLTGRVLVGMGQTVLGCVRRGGQHSCLHLMEAYRRAL